MTTDVQGLVEQLVDSFAGAMTIPSTYTAKYREERRAALIDYIQRQAAELSAAQAALRKIKDALDRANMESPRPIVDTILMPEGNETLFDFIEAALSTEGEQHE